MVDIKTVEIDLHGHCTRPDAKTVDCPKCGAVAGSPCEGRRGERKQCHRERHWARQWEAPERPLEKRFGTTDEEVLKVACPLCHSPKGQRCTGRRGQRETFHVQRHQRRLALASG